MDRISDHAEEDHLGEDQKDEGMGHVLQIFAAIGIAFTVFVIASVGLIAFLF